MQTEYPRMTRGETIFAWVYLPCYLLLVPVLIQLLLTALGRTYDIYDVNLIYFYVNFLALAIGCRGYLARSLRETPPLRMLSGVVRGFLLHMGLSALASILLSFLPVFENPADTVTIGMIRAHRGMMIVCAVLLGPLVEEVLMRGLIFAPLLRKSRLLAYGVSALVFSALHLVDFIGEVPPQTLLLSLLDYLPGAIALAYAYEKGGSIWSAVFLHMLQNALSIFALRFV